MRLVLIAAFFGLSGCVMMQAQFAPSLAANTYSVRTPPEKIELFRSGVPTKKFAEIGAVSSCCSLDTNALIEQLRKKASESGGDAIVGLDIRASGSVVASVIRYSE